MAAAIQLDPSRNETSEDSYLSGRVARNSGSSGDDMDNVLQRLGAVESSVSALRVEVSGIAATIPHLATKEDLKNLEAKVSGIEAVMPHLATKEDLKNLEAKVSGIEAVMPHLVSGVEAVIPHLATKADLGAMETKIIQWIIATVLASTGLTSSIAFSIAKLVH
jgi:hypothetical protein